jgi:glycosyltransferase involved in cell wall biosynthesis/ubiquinone/menaquinone biosynthesis C-methylase UbiE
MKICIVANNAYGALTGEESGHIGGVERQTALFSQWLTKRGHKVSVITWNEGGAAVESIHGVEIIKLCKVSDGIPILRFFTPRWTSLNRALSTSNADIYYHNCIESLTGQIALWCKKKHKPFIYSTASETDCRPDLMLKKDFKERNLFKCGLKNANLIIAQTNRQKALLKENFNLDSIVIPMPGTPAIDYDQYAIESEQFTQNKIIWIGRICEVKRLEWFIKAAEELSFFKFEVIGPVDRTNRKYDKLINQIETMPNISFLGRINRDELHKIYKHAAVLCCTSISEGFPNTFLEAWSYQTPVVTTFDPDNIIQKEKLGIAVSNIPDLVNALSLIMNNVELRSSYAKNALHYYTENHSLERVMLQFESAFKAQLFNPKTSLHFDQKSKQWNQFYDDKNALSISHLDLQRRLSICHSMLDKIKLSDSAYTLDVGCGTGEIANILTNKNQYAIDFSKEMSLIAQKSHPQLTVLTADATNIPFDTLYFDAAISLGVLEYIENYQLALTEINRVLREGSPLIISFPNKSSLFREINNIERCIIKPIKFALRLKNNSLKPERLFHQKWSLCSFSEALKNSGFEVIEVQYGTYGFLNPKLVSSPFNIKICNWLNNKKNLHTWLMIHLAHTTVVLAKKKR